jgi:hypothetical protein
MTTTNILNPSSQINHTPWPVEQRGPRLVARFSNDSLLLRPSENSDSFRFIGRVSSATSTTLSIVNCSSLQWLEAIIFKMVQAATVPTIKAGPLREYLMFVPDKCIFQIKNNLIPFLKNHLRRLCPLFSRCAVLSCACTPLSFLLYFPLL